MRFNDTEIIISLYFKTIFSLIQIDKLIRDKGGRYMVSVMRGNFSDISLMFSLIKT